MMTFAYRSTSHSVYDIRERDVRRGVRGPGPVHADPRGGEGGAGEEYRRRAALARGDQASFPAPPQVGRRIECC